MTRKCATSRRNASALLSANLAIDIGACAAIQLQNKMPLDRTSTDNGRDHSEHHTIKGYVGAYYMWSLISQDIVFVSYLALIADSRFGRELASSNLSRISKKLCYWIFHSSLWLSMNLKKAVIYNRLRDVRNLLQRSLGLQRICYLAKSLGDNIPFV